MNSDLKTKTTTLKVAAFSCFFSPSYFLPNLVSFVLSFAFSSFFEDSCLVFILQDEPGVQKREDAIIARTWLHYIEWDGPDPDPDIILQLPMTKVTETSSVCL